MYEFSIVDGFIDVNQSLEEMIKYLANEPSVGLFFVQQHAQNSMPNLLNLKDKVVENTHETILHTEDLEDSICAVRSMTECGLPIADEMIKDINKSLLLMATGQPRKGLIQSRSWGFGRGILRAPGPVNYSGSTAQQDERRSRNYMAAVFNSAKQKAGRFRWPQHDSTMKNAEVERLASSSTLSLPRIAVATPTLMDTEAVELPLSSYISEDQLDEQENSARNSPGHDLSSKLETSDKFKSDQEAKLEDWLQEPEDQS